MGAVELFPALQPREMALGCFSLRVSWLSGPSGHSCCGRERPQARQPLFFPACNLLFLQDRLSHLQIFCFLVSTLHFFCPSRSLHRFFFMNLYGKWIQEAQFGVCCSVVSLLEVSSEVCKGVWPSTQPRITQ